MNTVWQKAVWWLVVLSTLGVLLGFGGRWSPVLDAVGYFRLQFAVLAALGGVLALGMVRWRVKWIGFGAAALAVAMLGPVWRGVERPPAGGADTRAVSVMTANVLGGGNPSLDLTASVLLAADADILATLESPPEWAEAGSLLMRHYPHSTVLPKARNGVVLWSKFPLNLVEIASASRDAPAFATARVDLGGGAGFGVTAVHLSWPLIADGAQGKQIEVTRSLLSAAAGPKLLMGDFNAPPWSQAMKRVEEVTRLDMIGGLRRTWVGDYPNPLQLLLARTIHGREIPSVLGHHIDHILPSAEVGVDQVEVIALPGSDHRAVWARLRVPLRVAGNLFAGG
jgi:endonuclease/exonuclease/phosphatase (EEP) superfamily protein YafD